MSCPFGLTGSASPDTFLVCAAPPDSSSCPFLSKCATNPSLPSEGYPVLVNSVPLEPALSCTGQSRVQSAQRRDTILSDPRLLCNTRSLVFDPCLKCTCLLEGTQFLTYIFSLQCEMDRWHCVTSNSWNRRNSPTSFLRKPFSKE